MPVNYADGKVYTIVNSVNDIIYVGSTAQPRLSSRMSGHRRHALTSTTPIYTAMRELGTEHFRMVLHHVFPCNSKDELEAEEYRTMEQIIETGKQVYNAIRQGKPGPETKEKMAKAHIGIKFTEEHKKNIAKAQFAFGSLTLQTFGNCTRWAFQHYDETGKLRKKSFSVAKYGNDDALFRAEEARRAVYPEWGNKEEAKRISRD